MRVVTRQIKANEAADKLAESLEYFSADEQAMLLTSGRQRLERLRALGPNPSPDDVDQAAGHPYCTKVLCTECKQTVELAVELTADGDEQATLCVDCLASGVWQTLIARRASTQGVARQAADWAERQLRKPQVLRAAYEAACTQAVLAQSELAEIKDRIGEPEPDPSEGVRVLRTSVHHPQLHLATCAGPELSPDLHKALTTDMRVMLSLTGECSVCGQAVFDTFVQGPKGRVCVGCALGAADLLEGGGPELEAKPAWKTLSANPRLAQELAVLLQLFSRIAMAVIVRRVPAEDDTNPAPRMVAALLISAAHDAMTVHQIVNEHVLDGKPVEPRGPNAPAPDSGSPLGLASSLTLLFKGLVATEHYRPSDVFEAIAQAALIARAETRP